MKNVKELFLSMAKAAAERALKRDGNRTTCVAFYQSKVPAKLEKFKNVKLVAGI